MPAPKNAPLYQQIYDEIKDAIEKGVYAPKERIPSELELAEQYEVSRITVRRAVEGCAPMVTWLSSRAAAPLSPRRTSTAGCASDAADVYRAVCRQRHGRPVRT